eukprot:COSAG02_NODE_18905_length_911_cov_1.072660_1_plen_60_part_00
MVNTKDVTSSSRLPILIISLIFRLSSPGDLAGDSIGILDSAAAAAAAGSGSGMELPELA